MKSHEVTDIVRLCSDVITRYTHFVDLGEAERVPELFTEDGLFTTPTEEHKGQEALSTRFKFVAEEAVRLPWVLRHVCTNVLVDAVSPEEATATVYVTIYRHDGPVDGPAPVAGPTKIGRYRDRLVKTDRGWRFAERHFSLDFDATATSAGTLRS
jgi:SnoaL-like domain